VFATEVARDCVVCKSLTDKKAARDDRHGRSDPGGKRAKRSGARCVRPVYKTLRLLSAVRKRRLWAEKD
jgi:hypothetical protein